MKDFSGGGTTGLPSGVIGGGAFSIGLCEAPCRQFYFKSSRKGRGTHSGGWLGCFKDTVVLVNKAIWEARDCECEFAHAPLDGAPTMS